jgi:hypothetical protein
MNAVDYLRENKNKNNVALALLRKENTADKLINNQLQEITVDDVIFSNYKKNKNEILHKVNMDKNKPNKNNSKILKLYLKQQASIINDMDF